MQDVAANKFQEREPCVNIRPRLGDACFKAVAVVSTEEEAPASSGPSARCGHRAKPSCKVTRRYEGPWNSPFSWLPWSEATGLPLPAEKRLFPLPSGVGGGPCFELPPVLSYPRSHERAQAGSADS